MAQDCLFYSISQTEPFAACSAVSLLSYTPLCQMDLIIIPLDAMAWPSSSRQRRGLGLGWLKSAGFGYGLNPTHSRAPIATITMSRMHSTRSEMSKVDAPIMSQSVLWVIHTN